MKQLSPRQAREALAAASATLLDVREEAERALACLPDSLWIPMAELPGRIDEIPREHTLIVMCHHGVRSAMAGDYLERQGFSAVCNLDGGIDAWSRDMDDSVPRY